MNSETTNLLDVGDAMASRTSDGRIQQSWIRRLINLSAVFVFVAAPGWATNASAAGDDCKPGPGTKCVEHDSSLFGPDPTYEDKPYDAKAQELIYGGKRLNKTQRPLLELGRPLYQSGPFTESSTIFGESNLAMPQFMIFGDARLGFAANDNGQDKAVGLFATRLNLDVDLRLTATERFHVFLNPLSDQNKFTRAELFLDDNKHKFKFEIEYIPEAGFFEGDLGAMWGGLIGKDTPFDLPFAVGLVPLLFQNGIWVEDAFVGGAFTIPALNSPTLDISNMDITFFVGVEDVTNARSFNSGPNSDEARIYGVTSFIEANRGYWEVGYGYTEERGSNGLGYHNLTASFTRRYRNWVSNSIRVIGNVGQDPDGSSERTANGFLLLVENSLITSLPSNFVPYFNFFFGFDRPQALARGAGMLKNTGIAFETDALTGFPFLDDTGHDSVGGAIGLELLGPSFNYQLVGEISVTQEWDGSGQSNFERQIGFSIRTQFPLTNALILRVDGIYGLVQGNDDVPGGSADIMGARTELRYKF